MYVPTEKILGCNYMKCSKCDSKWCWFCLKQFENEKEHFDVNGSCPGFTNPLPPNILYDNCFFMFI